MEASGLRGNLLGNREQLLLATSTTIPLSFSPHSRSTWSIRKASARTKKAVEKLWSPTFHPLEVAQYKRAWRLRVGT